MPIPPTALSCAFRPAFRRLFAVLGALVLSPAAGQTPSPAPDARGDFDPDTARSLLNYPRDPVVDYHHMKLEIDIPDMNTPRLDAVQTLSFTPIAFPLSTLALDARLLEIGSVRLEGSPETAASFEHDGRSLRVSFDPPVPPGERRELVTTYAVSDPPLGLIWTPEHPAWPDRPPQIHSQGQSEDNSYWFPCHDFPNERLTTELVVTVPPGFVVSSNGRLVSQSAEPDLQPTGSGRVLAVPARHARQRFHWLQDKPHVNYLVSMVVGQFDVVDVGTRKLPLPVYAPPGRGDDVVRTYGRTARMVQLFERRFSEPYPWERYAQLIVWNFAAGGMENTGATTLFDTAVLSRAGADDGDLDDLISHELAHQWFGDLVTCRSWEHIWLNEGFATYAEALWMEERDGFEGYQAAVRAWCDTLARTDRGEAPGEPGMVSKEYKHPDDVFGRASDPYAKGAVVLHMLRHQLGDDVFFRALGAYVDRFRLGLVDTGDFRRVLEEVSGESLERFFTQWCRRPGLPRLEVASEWLDGTNELRVTVKQTQTVDGYNPAFAFDLPIWVGQGSTYRRFALPVGAREARATWVLESAPTWVGADPEMTVLAEVTLTGQPARWRTEQLLRGPTLAARVQGARGLTDDRSAEASSALWAVFADERQHDVLRAAAIKTLSERPGAAWLDDLASHRVRDPQVREAAVEAVAGAASRPEPYPTVLLKAKPWLVAMAQDSSERVRSAAIKGIGRVKDTKNLALVAAAADEPSQHDRLREAALEALTELDVAEGLAIAIRCAQPGLLADTRETAIGAIVKLAHHDRETAYGALVPLLGDRERNVWMAAVSALADLGDPRARDELERLRVSKRAEPDVAHIGEALARLATERAPNAG